MNELKTKQVRTCLMCKGKAPKSKLLRFVCLAGEVLWDKEQKLPGRGAYVHGKPGCMALLMQPGIWERALHLNAGSLSAAKLHGALSEAWKQLVRT